MFEATRQTNLSATVRNGTTVTANATPHAVGAWTEIIDNLSAEAQGFWIRILGVSANSTDTSALLDIAHADVGGGNETVIASDLQAGNAEVRTFDSSMGRVHFVPAVVAAGRSITVRLRAAVVSETAIVAVMAKLGAVHMEDAAAFTSYGAVTASSRGTLVPEASGAWGAWTSIGTTSADHKLFIPGFDAGGDTTIATNDTLLQLGYGASAPDAGGTAIDAVWAFATTGQSEGISGPFPQAPIYADLPSGTQLWARLAGAGTENRGIVIHGANATVVTAGGGGGGLLTHPGMAGGISG